MDQHLRLFIAIDLPEDVKRLLGELQSQLRQHTDAVRWADPQGTHLTLKFLGTTRANVVPQIVAALEQTAAYHRAFELQTGDLGVFPSLRRPRVIWLGLNGNVSMLGSLYETVERYVAPLGFPTEQRPFSPHLTLGRSLKDPTPPELASISRAVQQTKVLRSIVFSVSAIMLMRSELLPHGARYTSVAEVALDGAA